LKRECFYNEFSFTVIPAKAGGQGHQTDASMDPHCSAFAGITVDVTVMKVGRNLMMF